MSGPPLAPATIAQMDALADHVSEGGSVAAWSRASGISQSRGDQLWQRIRRGLGEQAG